MTSPPPIPPLLSLRQLEHHPALAPLHVPCPLPGIHSLQPPVQFNPSPHSGLCSAPPG